MLRTFEKILQRK